jgi:CRISPR-associated protein Cas2
VTINFGGFNSMWLIVLFDLPTETSQQRKEYTKFRTHLLKSGFTMMQYSVYIRHSASEENTESHINRVRSVLPPRGEVRILRLTDKQYGKMEVFYGAKRAATEKAALQLQFF